MTTPRRLRGLVVGCLLLWGSVTPAWAAPSIEQMLAYRPRHDDVHYSMPSPEEQKLCKIEPIKNAKGQIFGWHLTDSRQQTLRRFLDTNGDNKIDIFCYCRDGVEIYREIDSNHNERADQFRWLNTGGMKWGVDFNEDGKIDNWRMISAEEVAHEVFLASVTRDFERLRVLFPTETEMRALKLPASQIEQLRTLQKQGPVMFQSKLAKIAGLTSKAKFLRVESAVPGCVPAESIGSDQDLIKFQNRAVLFETPDQKHDWLHTGDMIQVGHAWRLIDVPGNDPEDIADPVRTDPELSKLLEALSRWDTNPPQTTGTVPNEKVVRYNLERVKLVEQILARVKPAERETWIKQLVDNLSTAGHVDREALARLSKMRQDFEKSMPGSKLTAYITYREMWAIYAPKINQPGTNTAGLQLIQDEWSGQLAKFVQTYPQGDDTPEALWQLGMGSEFSGKDEEAKRWYAEIGKQFAGHHLAPKSQGAVRRLSLVGKDMELAGPILGTAAPYNVANAKGKIVIVYYWASYCTMCASDFAVLKQLHSQYSAKGLEIVCVNLDDQPIEAANYLKTNQVPATHLFLASKEGAGLNSPLATHYGITGLPTMFLVGRDGRVASRNLQVNDLVSELRKAL